MRHAIRSTLIATIKRVGEKLFILDIIKFICCKHILL